MATSTPRYAWYGRVSTEDEQDPTLSFPGQLRNAEKGVVESGGLIVAHFYDVESGTRKYDARGSGGLSGFDIPIPRDGGLHDLLEASKRRPLAFDRVIVESISRLSRNSSVAFRIGRSCQLVASACVPPTSRWRNRSGPSCYGTSTSGSPVGTTTN